MTKTHHSNYTAALASVLIYGHLLLAAEPAENAPKVPSCPLQLTIKLALDRPEVVWGQDVAIRLEIENRGDPIVRVFNPFLQPLFELPIEWRFYNTSGKQVAALSYRSRRGSRALPGESDYVYLPHLGGVCIDWNWHCGNVDDQPFYDAAGNLHKTLPPGKYLVAAVAYKALTTFHNVPQSDITTEGIVHFWDNFDRGELCRSNMLPIVIAETK